MLKKSKELKLRPSMSKALLLLADMTLQVHNDHKLVLGMLDQMVELEKDNLNFKLLNAYEMIHWIAQNKLDDKAEHRHEMLKHSKNTVDTLIAKLPFWWERRDHFIIEEMTNIELKEKIVDSEKDNEKFMNNKNRL